MAGHICLFVVYDLAGRYNWQEDDEILVEKNVSFTRLYEVEQK